MSERARALEQAREWQAIAYGDRPETWAALDYYRELGWPVDSNKFPERERVEGRIFAFMSGYREALKAAVDPPPSGASPQADELGQALVNFMVDLESAQVELPPEVATVLRENRWDLYEGAPVAPASPQAETREDMGDGWYVTVGRWAESIVTIEQRSLSGKADLTDDDAALIRGAAKHLQAFIGQPMEPTPEPETCEWRWDHVSEVWRSSCPTMDYGDEDAKHDTPTMGWKVCPYCTHPVRLVPSEETK